jgi:periplasmic divalent cation tolerance protein
MSTEITLIYCPCPTPQVAQEIASSLLNEKLIACANITQGESLYHWEGSLTRSTEAYLLCKTTPELAPSARNRLQTLHPYEIPAILSFSADATTPFAAWLTGEVQK